MRMRRLAATITTAIACCTPEGAPRETPRDSPTPTPRPTPPRPTPPQPTPPSLEWKDPVRDPGPARPTQISLGRTHGCARMSDDSMRCWGGNDWGQLGSGDALVTTRQATPPIGDVVEVAAGGTFTCARKRDRSVWCWGYDLHGVLGGAPSSDTVTAPTRIASITDAVALAAGNDHVCVVRDDGTAWCWGSNFAGTLGDGTDAPRVGPVQVQGLADATAIAAGDFTCARRRDGAALCWGMNQGLAAAPVAGLAGVVDLGLGNIGCARLEDGTAHCWGLNDSGQLGRGASANGTAAATAGPVLDLADVKAVDTAAAHACAVVGDGAVRCWGDVRPYPWTSADCRYTTDHRGYGGSAAQWQYCPKPTALPGVTGAIALSLGWDRACALTRDGAVWCWGDGAPPARLAL